MKNRLFCLLFTALFALGNFAFSTSLSGVGITDILIGKNGDVICSFTVPDQYLDKQGELTLPIQIIIRNNNRTVYSTFSNDLKAQLPSNLSGSYFLETSIGNFSSTQKINL